MKDGKWFPYLLLGLLLLPVGANIVLIIKANSDPSFAVEPDYYQKAIEWDEHQVALAKSEALGWNLSVDAQNKPLRVNLRDALGQPIDNASVSVEAFPNARASHRVRSELQAQSGGVYVLKTHLELPGIWEFRWVATLGDKQLMKTTREELR